MTSRDDPTRPLAPEELEAMMEAAHRPGILLNKTARPDDPGAPGCWLGGEPTLPPEIEWPWFERDGKRLVPMHFVVQINLATLPQLDEYPDVPNTGTLFFFYDTVLAPIQGLGVSGTKVIYVAEELAGQPPRRMPDIPPLIEGEGAYETSFWYAKTPTQGYRRWNIDFIEIDTFSTSTFANPDFFSAALEANLEIHDRLEYLTETRRSGTSEPRSHEFVPHMLLGARSLESVPEQSLRLLSVGNDRDLGLVHGDLAWLGFWIRIEDLKNRNFTRVTVFEED